MNWQAIEDATVENGKTYLVQCTVRDTGEDKTFVDWYVCTADAGELIGEMLVLGDGVTMHSVYEYMPTHVAEIVEAKL